MTSAEFRQLRQELGLSQAGLARIMGMAGPQAVHKIETIRRPTNIQAAFIRYISETRNEEGNNEG